MHTENVISRKFINPEVAYSYTDTENSLWGITDAVLSFQTVTQTIAYLSSSWFSTFSNSRQNSIKKSLPSGIFENFLQGGVGS